MKSINGLIRQFERQTENDRSRQAEADEDRCRMEGEDNRLQEEMDNDLRVAKAYHQSLNFMLDSIFGKVNHGK